MIPLAQQAHRRGRNAFGKAYDIAAVAAVVFVFADDVQARSQTQIINIVARAADENVLFPGVGAENINARGALQSVAPRAADFVQARGYRRRVPRCAVKVNMLHFRGVEAEIIPYLQFIRNRAAVAEQLHHQTVAVRAGMQADGIFFIRRLHRDKFHAVAGIAVAGTVLLAHDIRTVAIAEIINIISRAAFHRVIAEKAGYFVCATVAGERVVVRGTFNIFQTRQCVRRASPRRGSDR